MKRVMDERHLFSSRGSNGKSVLADEIGKIMDDHAIPAKRPADEEPCPHQQRRREDWLRAARAH